VIIIKLSCKAALFVGLGQPQFSFNSHFYSPIMCYLKYFFSVSFVLSFSLSVVVPMFLCRNHMYNIILLLMFSSAILSNLSIPSLCIRVPLGVRVSPFVFFSFYKVI